LPLFSVVMKPKAIGLSEPNEPALIEAHERIVRETIPKLRALPLPPAVRWPYEGRAFSLMEEFGQYGKSNEAVPRTTGSQRHGRSAGSS
jgi:hypothetical protein